MHIQHADLIELTVGFGKNGPFFAFKDALDVMRSQTSLPFATVEVHIVDRGATSTCQVECTALGMVFTGVSRVTTAGQESTRVCGTAVAVKPLASGGIGARSHCRIILKSQIIIRLVVQAAIQEDTRFRGITVTIKVATIWMRRTLSEITLATIQVHIIGLRVRLHQ